MGCLHATAHPAPVLLQEVLRDPEHVGSEGAIRPEPHRTAPPGWVADGPLQLPVCPIPRREVYPQGRGHRPGNERISDCLISLKDHKKMNIIMLKVVQRPPFFVNINLPYSGAICMRY